MLRVARMVKGMTQEQLAEELGVVRQTISNIECGISKPSIELAKRIGEVLDVNWWELFDE